MIILSENATLPLAAFLMGRPAILAVPKDVSSLDDHAKLLSSIWTARMRQALLVPWNVIFRLAEPDLIKLARDLCYVDHARL